MRVTVRCESFITTKFYNLVCTVFSQSYATSFIQSLLSPFSLETGGGGCIGSIFSPYSNFFCHGLFDTTTMRWQSSDYLASVITTTRLKPLLFIYIIVCSLRSFLLIFFSHWGMVGNKFPPTSKFVSLNTWYFTFLNVDQLVCSGFLHPRNYWHQMILDINHTFNHYSLIDPFLQREACRSCL